MSPPGALGVELEVIDVDSDPRLDERYGDDVPVLHDRDGASSATTTSTPDAIRCLG